MLMWAHMKQSTSLWVRFQALGRAVWSFSNTPVAPGVFGIWGGP
jgi:hypothetical protein